MHKEKYVYIIKYWREEKVDVRRIFWYGKEKYFGNRQSQEIVVHKWHFDLWFYTLKIYTFFSAYSPRFSPQRSNPLCIMFWYPKENHPDTLLWRRRVCSVSEILQTFSLYTLPRSNPKRDFTDLISILRYCLYVQIPPQETPSWTFCHIFMVRWLWRGQSVECGGFFSAATLNDWQDRIIKSHRIHH